jgi:hypothetical protein
LPGCYTGIRRLARLADTIRSVYGRPQPTGDDAGVEDGGPLTHLVDELREEIQDRL